MSVRKAPLNIKLLSNSKQRLAGLLPVTTMEIFGQGREFAPTGLYSDLIFGSPGTEERSRKHGYISLNCQILHPKIFEDMTRLKEIYKGILQGKVYAQWDPEAKDFVRSDVLDGETGYAFFMKHFKEIEFKRTKSYRRDIVIDLINDYRDQAVLNFLIVMPAGLRDLEIDEQDRPVEQEINKLYRKVLAASNGISETLAYKNDPVLNQTRWSIQSNVQLIWETIIGMLGGKGGFLQSKWGSRRVAFATANVISSMDPAGDDLDGPRSYDSTVTHVGIYQYVKGTEPLMASFQMPQGMAQSVVENADQSVDLIDPTTYQPKTVELSEKERVRWGSEKGRAELINAFSETERRHRPLLIDGHYLKLVYQDKAGVRVMDSIGELPEGWDASLVRPMTWGEYFYMEAFAYLARVRCFVTRYPVTGPGSTYASVPYLRSTTNAKVVRCYNEAWEIDESLPHYPEFPNTPQQASFFNTSSPSPFALENLGADFDGDE